METDKKSIEVLDCTLRDGSYLIDYQFNTMDTFLLARGLARAGIKMVEVGHGTGLGSSRGKAKSAAGDCEYVEAAKSAVAGTGASVGSFFIPGIGNLDDIRSAAAAGLNFLRVGTDITRLEEAAPFIEEARKLGLVVWSNLMKSYVLSPQQVGRAAAEAKEMGAQVVAVVDSAGGMFPYEISEYVRAAVQEAGIPIGFHGHNNLQLAVANCLAAVEAGAKYLDLTLQGMGRSAGNAQTEIVVGALHKLGYETGADTLALMDMGERLVRPMMHTSKGVGDVAVISGLARFHSSFMEIAKKFAAMEEVDLRQLILKVCEIDQLTLTEETAGRVASCLQKRSKADRGSFVGWSPKSTDEREDTPGRRASKLVRRMGEESGKSGKPTVFTLTLNHQGRERISHIRVSHTAVIGNMEAASLDDAEKILLAVDGDADWILVDECRRDLVSLLDSMELASRVARYSELRILASAVGASISTLEMSAEIAVLAPAKVGEILAALILAQGRKVSLYKDSQIPEGELRNAYGVVALNSDSLPKLGADDFHKDARIVLASIGGLPSGLLNELRETGRTVHRVDSRAALAAEIFTVITGETQRLGAGSKRMLGIPVVAGGVVGERGAVVLDSLLHPRRVLGIADGEGGFLADGALEEHREDVEKISAHIVDLMLGGHTAGEG